MMRVPTGFVGTCSPHSCVTPQEKADTNHVDIDGTDDGKTCSHCGANFLLFMTICPNCGRYER